jgi:outer membrane protein OmpA-like peptidoglycan-associated protein
MRELRLPLLLASVVLLLVAGGCANRPPVLNCVADMSTITEGNSVTIQSNATDPDRNDQLTFDWSAARGKLTTENGSATFDSSGLSAGNYDVGLEVRDKKQNLATCEVSLMVDKNRIAPTVACEPSNVNVTEGQSTTVAARASDGNNDALTYAWSVDGSSVTNNRSSFEFGTAGRSIGGHTVQVTVSDVDKMTANCQFNVTVDRRPNTGPTVALTLDKNDVYAGEPVSANAQASDAEGDPMTYAWTLDGRDRSDTSSSISVNTTGLSGGKHSVAVTVQDDRDGSGSATQTLSVREKIVVQVSGIRPDNLAKAALDEIALKMRQNSQLRATLTGHTDDRGSEEVNERTGQRRADAVKAYLVDEQNVADGRIAAGSAGETQPAADNETTQGREDNRRVEIELYVP